MQYEAICDPTIACDAVCYLAGNAVFDFAFNAMIDVAFDAERALHNGRGVINDKFIVSENEKSNPAVAENTFWLYR